MIGLNMTVIWGYLKFCWFMLDFHKYQCYNLPHVTTCPGLPSLPLFLLLTCRKWWGVLFRPTVKRLSEFTFRDLNTCILLPDEIFYLIF